MNKLDEIVYALSIKDLFGDILPFNGTMFYQSPEILNNIYTKARPIKRRDCENDPTKKHVIPYVVLTSANNKIFVTQRTSNQTEVRLWGRSSVGVGGHVGPIGNYSIAESIMYGMLRELDEELTGMKLTNFIAGIFKPNLMGYVNDDSNEVGAVHFGLIYNIFVDSILAKGVGIKETENMTGSWMSYKQAKKIENYETWSAYIMEGMK